MNQSVWQEKIRLLMKFGKTQHQIAEFCAVSDSAIHKLRHNSERQPTWVLGNSINKMCALLNLDE